MSTYGKRFIEDTDILKVNDFQRLVIDDLFPCYQRMIETELGILSFEKRKESIGVCEREDRSGLEV